MHVSLWMNMHECVFPSVYCVQVCCNDMVQDKQSYHMSIVYASVSCKHSYEQLYSDDGRDVRTRWDLRWSVSLIHIFRCGENKFYAEVQSSSAWDWLPLRPVEPYEDWSCGLRDKQGALSFIGTCIQRALCRPIAEVRNPLADVGL